jgi:Peptidase family C25
MTHAWSRGRIVSFALVSALVAGLLGPTAFTQSLSRIDPGDAAKASPLRLAQIATAGPDGVLIEWRTEFEINNLGFNVYRVRNGQRTRISRSIIPGSALIVGEGRALYGGYSYSQFDPEGSLDCEYYIEDVDVAGNNTLHDVLKPVWETNPSKRNRSANSEAASSQPVQREWAGAEPTSYSESAEAIEDQWAIAALPSLKIAVKAEGWYRITQAQLVTSGFNVSADARNLRMFAGGTELAIYVSRVSGPLGSSDYVEFYGNGLDILSTDTRIYYLVNGTQPGLRIAGLGDVKPTSTPPPPTPEPPPSSLPKTPKENMLDLRGWIFGGSMGVFGNSASVTDNSASENRSPTVSFGPGPVLSVPEEVTTVSREAPIVSARKPEITANATKEDFAASRPSLNEDPATSRGSLKRNSVRKRKRTANLSALRTPRKPRLRNRRTLRMTGVLAQRQRNHAGALSVTVAAPNFSYTVKRQDRFVYITTVLNGDAENFFGDVIRGPNASNPNPNPTLQTLSLQNIETSAAGPAQLRVGLQGVLQQPHLVSVKLNGTLVGSIGFFGLEHKEETFAVPVSLLVEGNNVVAVVGTAPPSGSISDTSLLDYSQVTYPHSFRPTNNTLKFSLRNNQSARLEGFSCNDARCTNVRILDVTNPLAVAEVRPVVEPSGPGYALTVVALGNMKGTRRLIALPSTGTGILQSALTLNQPSTWNLSSNAGNLVIISHQSLISSLAPYISQRQAQGFTVTVVDIEDLYDEFSYGLHSPQAITEFVSRARNVWATPPQYLLFVGDASYDPRDYQVRGFCDFIPTRLVDTAFTETVSDDALIDYNNDGIADIPVGRLPSRTPVQTSLMVSKIVNFVPPNPQTALLVADAQGTYYFNFEAANDQVGALLQSLDPSITLQKVYRFQYPDYPSVAQAHADLMNKLNAGPALVNYSGHGNVNSWAGGLFSTDDALILTNGSTLPFVVVMDCLNGFFAEPSLAGEGIAEGLLKAQNGGSVGSFASTGLTIPDGQHEMSTTLYQLLYGSTPIRVGDAIIQAKADTFDIDVRRTWVLLGDPTLKIR